MQIAKPVVYRSSRKHQNLCLDSVLNNLVQKPLKTIALSLILNLG